MMMNSLYDMSDDVYKTFEIASAMADMLNFFIEYQREKDMPVLNDEGCEIDEFLLRIEYGNNIRVFLDVICDNEVYFRFNIYPSTKIEFVNFIRKKEGKYINKAVILDHNEEMPNDIFIMFMQIENYNDFLNTYYWKCRREYQLEKAGNKCQLCSNQDEVLNVHHNNYENIGLEKDNDLIVLCRSCHKKFHDIL